MPEQPVSPDQIDQDVRLMVSGKFVVDHIGPDAVNEVSTHARANADTYLDVFESLFLGPNFDALTHSNLRLPAFLTFMAEVKPERVRALAEKLLRQYTALLVVFDSVTDKEALRDLLPTEMFNLSVRIDRQRAALQRLAAS